MVAVEAMEGTDAAIARAGVAGRAGHARREGRQAVAGHALRRAGRRRRDDSTRCRPPAPTGSSIDAGKTLDPRRRGLRRAPPTRPASSSSDGSGHERADWPFASATIGVGHLGRHHARLLADAARRRRSWPRSISSPSARRPRSRAPAPRRSTDYRALFGRVDAVTVAVPTVDHLARGARVSRARRARARREADGRVARRGRRDARARLARPAPRWRSGTPSDSTRRCGGAAAYCATPRFIEVHRLSGFPERSLDIDVVFDVMIHDLDIILAVDRSEVVSVEAIGVPVLTPQSRHRQRPRSRSRPAASPTSRPAASAATRSARCASSSRTCTSRSTAAAQELEVWRLAAPRRRAAGDRGRQAVAVDAERAARRRAGGLRRRDSRRPGAARAPATTAAARWRWRRRVAEAIRRDAGRRIAAIA